MTPSPETALSAIVRLSLSHQVGITRLTTHQVSGHGSQVPNLDHTEPDGFDEGTYVI